MSHKQQTDQTSCSRCLTNNRLIKHPALGVSKQQTDQTSCSRCLTNNRLIKHPALGVSKQQTDQTSCSTSFTNNRLIKHPALGVSQTTDWFNILLCVSQTTDWFNILLWVFHKQQTDQISCSRCLTNNRLVKHPALVASRTTDWSSNLL